MKLDQARDVLVPSINRLKAEIFNHDPDELLCLHRKDIAKFKGKFGALRNDELRMRYEAALIDIFTSIEYIVITALIDKAWMLRQGHWTKNHPYHYLMEILTEKYALLLRRMNSTGDIMPEARHGNSDKALQSAFTSVREAGTRYADRDFICSRIPSSSLKFRSKSHNIAGLQLCDLLAHPSHYKCRETMGHDVCLRGFAITVQKILIDHKYDRSHRGSIRGYGIKTLG